jgi:bifunctional UDP-N-acetylglucosamine pyrophosphorylase/glucosamine-1-phosphate N-acetyltransferase
MDLHVVILAAGKGTRMKSVQPKVLHAIAGKTIVDRVLEAAGSLQPSTTTLVLGHAAESVRNHFGNRPEVQTVIQEPQLGTGHALLQTAPVLRGREGTVVLLSGDVPLLTAQSLRGLIETHQQALPRQPSSLPSPNAPTATAGSFARRAGLPASSRNGMPRRHSATFRKSTRASMPSTLRRSSTHSSASGPITPRASTTCRIS